MAKLASKIRGVSAADMRVLRVSAKQHMKAGLSPQEAMRKAIDGMIDEAKAGYQGAHERVSGSALPARDIHFSLRE